MDEEQFSRISDESPGGIPIDEIGGFIPYTPVEDLRSGFMDVAVPIIGIAFAAFCIWLLVRIVNRRERWAKWTAVGLVIGLPVLYVLSFGPACWATSQPRPLVNPPQNWMFIYLPLSLYIREKKPEPCSLAMWVRLGLPRHHCVALPFKFKPLLWYTVRVNDER